MLRQQHDNLPEERSGVVRASTRPDALRQPTFSRRNFRRRARLWRGFRPIRAFPRIGDRLRAISSRSTVAARSSPQKHAWRARIIFLTDQYLGTNAIMAATAKSKTCVWRWQERCMAEGIEVCCATRPGDRHRAARPRAGRQSRGADTRSARSRSDALDGSRDAQGGRHRRVLGREDQEADAACGRESTFAFHRNPRCAARE